MEKARSGIYLPSGAFDTLDAVMPIPLPTHTLVLNASHEPLSVVPLRRAFTLVEAGKADLIESAGLLRSPSRTFDAPAVVRLSRYVHVPYRRSTHAVRRVVLARDCYLCQYCGRGSRALTVDHVMPRSRGGDGSWENVVAACVPCNRRKGARLPQEAGMRLMQRPLAPSRALLLCRGIRSIPALWEPYLAYAS